ncbi:hypothetical protein HDU87_006355 [Geranomyces variabilis]|uniref:Uncharacterized protein n=1 Tax=Geranomyces variabilis TaxID=109894 RepID=A0AAD5TI29_9FUNG|nr:hypothetical protein HDU87_006355 [Geranomyces variabilis]
MLAGLELVVWDLLVVVGLILLILWILSLAHVFLVNTGPIKHIFVVLAVLFLALWVLVRCCGCGGRKRGRNNIV